MPHYFFHVRGGPNAVEDEEGWIHADEARAFEAATRAARGLIATDVLEGILDLESRIDVEDGGGSLVFTVPFASVVTRQ